MVVFVCVSYLMLTYGLQGGRTFFDFWLKAEISRDIFSPLNKNEFLNTLIILIAGYIVMLIFMSIMYFLWVTSSAQNLFVWLTQKVLYSKMAFFDKNTFGRIISRFASDIAVVNDELPW